jgi:hypothetical protein
VSLSRHTRKLTSWLVAAALLFAQAMGAAHACVGAAHSPAMAFAQTAHEGGCHQTMNRNSCLQQCTADNQNIAEAQVAIAELPVLAGLTVPLAAHSSARLPHTVVVPARSPDPPASIRFCSFQL